MAFIKKTWNDRQSEYPNRRSLTDEDGNVWLVTVARDEGGISEEGDPFNAETMNDLEKRIEAAVNECFQSVSDGKALVASAITDKGVLTDATATFAEMASAIRAIKTEDETYKLYMSSANEGGFSAYAGSTHAAYEHVNFAPSVTFEDKMTVIGSQEYQNAYGCGCVISEPIDLTNFSRIFFDYECSLSANNDNSISVFITPTKKSLLNDVVVFNEYLLEGRHYLTSSGIKGIDVSALSGEYYIGFSMMYTSPATIRVSNMYATAIKK